MLLTQLHRKVPLVFEGMEDVLTSSIFGLFKYLPNALACQILSECAGISATESPIQVELWPRYPTPPGFVNPTAQTNLEDKPSHRGDTEPDALIVTKNWLVLIEAKYRSALDEAYDQLGREFAIGHQLAQQTNRAFRLLVVTRDARPPKPAGIDLAAGVQNAIRAASAGLGHKAIAMAADVPRALLWVNWQHLYSVFSANYTSPMLPGNVYCLLSDTCALLELRGLKPYDPRQLLDAMHRWEKSDVSHEQWALPVAYRYATVASVTAGWAQLYRFDTSMLDPIAWRLRSQVAEYHLGPRLEHFELESLGTRVWQPFQQSRRSL